MSIAAATARTHASRLGGARPAILALAALLLGCGRSCAQAPAGDEQDLAFAPPSAEPALVRMAERRPAAPAPPPAGELIACLPEFDGGSRILFELPAGAGRVRLRIEDGHGAELALLQDGALPAGEHAAAFDYRALVGDTCWAVLESGGQRRAMKLHLMQ